MTARYQYHIKSWQELSSDELYQLLRLRSEIFVVEQECAYQDLDNQDKTARHLLVTTENKQLVAYSRIYETVLEGCRYRAIGRVCTKQSVRGQGIALRMMKQAISSVESNRPLPITISAQSYLQSFYESLDFKVASEPYLEDGIPHIRMIRK